MATRSSIATNEEIVIHTVNTETLQVYLLGKTPLICNRMANKIELLAPKGKKTAADKASTMKHDPVREFRASPYRLSEGPTELGAMPTWFKKGMMAAALDTPGARKSQIGRLVNVHGEIIALYGIPQLKMDIVRSADFNHTPDVRTRAALREWACELSIRFVRPMLRAQSVINLLAAAGLQSGCGDWRQEKGSGGYGAYEIVSPDNADYKRIVKTQGRDAQVAALENPVAYDDESSELLARFDVELKRRGFHTVGGQIENKVAA